MQSFPQPPSRLDEQLLSRRVVREPPEGMSRLRGLLTEWCKWTNSSAVYLAVCGLCRVPYEIIGSERSREGQMKSFALERVHETQAIL
jgi:hypothetical protein